MIFVKNLNFNTTEEKLKFAFSESKAGKVQSVKIVRNKEDRSKGYGFVQFDSYAAAVKAMKMLQGIIIDEHSL